MPGLRISQLPESDESQLLSTSIVPIQLDNANSAYTQKTSLSVLWTALKRLFSAVEKPTVSTIAASQTLTRLEHRRIFVDVTTNSGFIITLPATPTDGDRIDILVCGRQSATVQINFNGRSFRGQSSGNISINPYSSFYLIFHSSFGWVDLPSVLNSNFNISQSLATSWTGTGAARDVLNMQFVPSLIFIKARSQAHNWRVFDAARGAGAVLHSDLNNASATEADGLLSFLSTGIRLGANAGSNQSAQNYDAFGFRCNIVNITGTGANRTIPHGLGKTPQFIIVKALSSAQNWYVYHVGNNVPRTALLNLNGTGAASSDATLMTADPDSINLYMGTSSLVNGSTINYNYYIFDVDNNNYGFYLGAGASAVSISTGFMPKLLIIRRVDSTGNWFLIQNSGVSPTTSYYLLNTTGGLVSTGISVTFTSTGFTISASDANLNVLNGRYIYCAFV